MKAFDRAFAIKPAAYVYLNRARALPFSDHAGRLADLDLALKLEPKNAEILAEKAEQLAVDGDVKSALALYDQVVRLVPEQKYFALRRAIWLYKDGRLNEAEKLFADQRTAAKSPSDFNSLCWNKATAGILLDSAVRDCQEGLRLNPQSGPIIDSMAFVSLRLGKVDEAIANYDTAVARLHGADSYMGRAIAYSRKGDKTRAQADRAEALKLDVDAETRFLEFGLKFEDQSAASSH